MVALAGDGSVRADAGEVVVDVDLDPLRRSAATDRVHCWDRSRAVDGPVDRRGEPVPLGHLPLFVGEGSRLLDLPAPDGS